VTIFRRQQAQAAYNIYNVSTGVDIYLDDSPQTPGTTTGLPLHPGAQITWEAGRECYAITATGLTATLLTSPAAGSYFDPYSLATNILTLAPGGLTLAQQIAAANNQISVLQTQTISPLADTTPFTFPIVSIGTYPSLRFYLQNGGRGYGGTVERTVTFNWYDDAAGTNLVAVDQFTVPCSGPLLSPGGGITAGGSYARGSYPRRANYVQVVGASATIGVNSTILFKLYGSPTITPDTSLRVFTYTITTLAGIAPTVLLDGTLGVYTISTAAPLVSGTSLMDVPRWTRSGIAYCSWSHSSGGAGEVVATINTLAGNRIAEFGPKAGAAAGFRQSPISVTIPSMAILVQITNSSGANAGVSFELAMGGD
jgi:hypothetical protein